MEIVKSNKIFEKTGSTHTIVYKSPNLLLDQKKRDQTGKAVDMT